jgi:hypothetical protein
MKTFAQLFKKYRLQAEFASLTELADAFAGKGFFYDLSIFSHWQSGKRIPGKREVLVALIELFVENEAIASVDQANEFLESAGHGYLTYREQERVMRKNYQRISNKFLFD